MYLENQCPVIPDDLEGGVERMWEHLDNIFQLVKDWHDTIETYLPIVLVIITILCSIVLAVWILEVYIIVKKAHDKEVSKPLLSKKKV